MNLEEYAAKRHVLRRPAVPMPRGVVCSTPEEASARRRAGSDLAWSRRRCRPASAANPAASRWRDTPDDGAAACARHPRHDDRRQPRRTRAGRGALPDRARVLCRRAGRCREPQSAGAVLDRRRHGHRGSRRTQARCDPAPSSSIVRRGFGAAEAAALLEGMQLGAATDAVADVLVKIYRAFCEKDAELVEINPLAILRGRQGRGAGLQVRRSTTPRWRGSPNWPRSRRRRR